MKKYGGLFISVLLVMCLCVAACGSGSGSLKDFAVPGGTYTGTSDSKTEANGEGTINFTNGNIYEGPVKKNKPEGSGVMIDAVSEGTYTGKFVDGAYFDTSATMEFDNGGIYTGAFEKGKMKGEGLFTWPTGDILKGTFLGSEGVSGTCGQLDAVNAKITYTTGLWYEGTTKVGFPDEGKFFWPTGTPTFTGKFTNFLNGYGDLDMGNGIIYKGTMGMGQLVPIAGYEDQEITVQYPENDVYAGEKFVGKYVFNEQINKDELVGKIIKKDLTEILNVKIMLDWSFSYRYNGTVVNGITYTGQLRDGQVPCGVGVYSWGVGAPQFTTTEGDGFGSGVGTLDMGGGSIVYYGSMNLLTLAPYNGDTELVIKIEWITGEKFEGKYVVIDPTATVKTYELLGSLTLVNGDVAENMLISTDFAFTPTPKA